MDLESALAIMLRNLRIECGLSQEKLALICNMDRTYISMLERKKRKPTLNSIFKICDALNIFPSDFIKEIEYLMYGHHYEIVTIKKECKTVQPNSSIHILKQPL